MRLSLPSKILRLALGSAALLTTVPALAAGHAHDNGYTALHARAVQAGQAFRARIPQADLEWQHDQAGVHMILDLDLPLAGEALAQRGEGFLRANEALIGVPAAQLRLVRTTPTKQRTVLRYQQVATVAGRDLHVLDGELTLTFDNANGHLLRLVNSAKPVLNLVAGTLTREAAVAKAAQALAGATFARGLADAATEAVIAPRSGARHVWVVHVPGATLKDLHSLAVDAETGAVTRLPNRIHD